MDVSVILVSYNTKDMTRDCLKSIYQFTQGVEFEVFVVDNNSSDGSVDMIAEEFPQVHLIRNANNKGFGAANNIAIRESNAKYVFCLNTDTLLLSNSIKEFYDFMEREENQNVGACGCQLLDKGKNPIHSYGIFHNLLDIIATIFYLHRICPKIYRNLFEKSNLENEIKPFVVDYVTGADLFMRKCVIDECGMFDEDFFMYSEESELQHRYNKSGYNSVIIPSVNIIHYCGMLQKNLPIKRLATYYKSSVLFYRKCYGHFAEKLAKTLYIIKFITTPRSPKNYFELIKMGIKL